MSELSKTISAALAGEYRMRGAELHAWVDPLSQEQFWSNPFPFGNSVGHLLLHLTGNLSYYIGTQVAGTGYVRHRDLEFQDDHRPPKAEVLAAADQAIAMVAATIEQQAQEDWSKPYSAEREPQAKDRFTIFLRCATHLYHHIGQIIYICRKLSA